MSTRVEMPEAFAVYFGRANQRSIKPQHPSFDELFQTILNIVSDKSRILVQREYMRTSGFEREVYPAIKCGGNSFVRVQFNYCSASRLTPCIEQRHILGRPVVDNDH